MNAVLMLFVLLVAVSGYVLSDQKARRCVKGELHRLHSRPSYHGLYTFMWTVIVG